MRWGNGLTSFGVAVTAALLPGLVFAQQAGGDFMVVADDIDDGRSPVINGQPAFVISIAGDPAGRRAMG